MNLAATAAAAAADLKPGLVSIQQTTVSLTTQINIQLSCNWQGLLHNTN
jgi:hypothetical protein